MGFAVIWSSCHSNPLICQTILLDVTSVFWKHPTICFVFIIRNNVGWHFKSWVRNPVFWQSQGWKIKHLTSITWRRQDLKDRAWQVGGLLGASFTVRLGVLYFTFSRWEVMVLSPKHESPVNNRAIVCKISVPTAQKTLCFSLIRLSFWTLKILWVRQTGKTSKVKAEDVILCRYLIRPIANRDGESQMSVEQCWTGRYKWATRCRLWDKPAAMTLCP